MSDHTPKKKKNSPSIAKWNFIARWVFGQLALASLASLAVWSIFDSGSLSNDLEIQLGQIIVTMIAMLIIVFYGLGLVQKIALKKLTDLDLDGWIFRTGTGVVISIIWFFVTSLLPLSSVPDFIGTIIAASPIVIFPIILQARILTRHISYSWIYALTGGLFGALGIAVWAFNGLTLIFWILAALYLFIPAYVLSCLFTTYRK